MKGEFIMANSSYVIITPAHNEAQFLPKVIDSIVAQKPRPTKWVIVDDRSTDETPYIVQEASQRYDFIKLTTAHGVHERKLGSNIVDIFNKGLKKLKLDADYLVKMDADIILDADYFRKMISHFDANPDLGIASGKLYIERNNKWIEERYPDFHATGACKMYRMNCFKDIGGLIPLYGWDILDGAKARMRGWETRSFREIPILHLRMLGTANGIIKGHFNHGRGMWAIRAHPLFVLGRAFYRAMEPPWFSGLFMLVGYIYAMQKREERLKDRKLARFLRLEQLSRLMGQEFGSESIIIKRLR